MFELFSPRIRKGDALIAPSLRSALGSDGAAGGVWGGMPPRPPHVVCADAISGDSVLSAKLLRDLDSNQDNILQRDVSYH